MIADLRPWFRAPAAPDTRTDEDRAIDDLIRETQQEGIRRERLSLAVIGGLLAFFALFWSLVLWSVTR